MLQKEKSLQNDKKSNKATEPSARQLAEMREKARINRLIILSEERAAAIAEGEAKGKAEARKELIRKAATSGMSAENISTLFEISIEEVKSTIQSGI